MHSQKKMLKCALSIKIIGWTRQFHGHSAAQVIPNTQVYIPKRRRVSSPSWGAAPKNTLFQGGICYECHLMRIVHMFSILFSSECTHLLKTFMNNDKVMISSNMEYHGMVETVGWPQSDQNSISRLHDFFKAMDDGYLKKIIIVISPSYFVESIYMGYQMDCYSVPKWCHSIHNCHKSINLCREVNFSQKKPYFEPP